MKKTVLFLFIFIYSLTLLPHASFAQVPANTLVTVPDTNLRAKITEELGKPSHAKLTAGDMLALTQLHAPNAEIRDLTGLEHARNLKVLSLFRNNISDVSPLTGLTQLTTLYLSLNSISDASALSGLTKLTYLNLGGNRLNDISALSGLTKLTNLLLWNNNLSDVSALANLTKLIELQLDSNGLSDVSALVGLTKLTYLSLYNNSLSDISALANLTQLTKLYLNDNSLSDISPLSGLAQLIHLGLSGNSLSDVSALAGLTQLTGLNLSGNRFVDVSSLSGLTKLTTLQLGSNRLSDVSALSELTELTFLQLEGNRLSDVSALSELTELTYLYLGYNDLSDVSAISGLTKLTDLSLGGNPLNYAAINTHIPALQTKGVNVRFDPRTPTTLLKVSGKAQQGFVGKTLQLPFVVEVRDEHDQAFAGVPVTFRVTAGGGHLSTTITTTDLDGKAQADLTLGSTPGKNTVSVAATSISQSVQFTATAMPISTLVSIPDVNLRAKITEALGKPSHVQLTAGDMLALTQLNASNADIQDLTGLEYAYNLKVLNLARNSLSDVSVLTKLTQLTKLFLSANPLSYTAINTHIPAMQAKGVDIQFDSRIPKTLRKVSGGKQQGLIGTVLPLPLVVEVRDQYNRTYAGVPVTFRINTGGGQLSATNTETDVNGKAQADLTLGSAPGTTTVSVTAADVSQAVQFKATAVDPLVSIPDTNLRAKITEALGKPSHAKLTAGDMLALTQLHAPDTNIQNLTGLEYAQNLRILSLYRNNISDVSPLTGLTQLTSLYLSQNSISDVSPLTGLTQLTTLYLSQNSISDVSVLSGLTELTNLDIGGNHLSDISVLSGLTKLTNLFVWSNNLSDVSALAELTELTTLNLFNNRINDLSVLSGLTKLTNLYLDNNRISDVSALSGLTKLTSLQLNINELVDVSVLSGLTKLTNLGLGNNRISDVSTLSGLTKLTNLGLGNNRISDVSTLSGLTKLINLQLNINELVDVSVLSGLTQLTTLYLGNNRITDVSVLSRLRKLTNLGLGNNRISDVSTLSGLTQLTDLSLGGNPLNYAAINTHIPALQAKGVNIQFDPRIPKALLKVSGGKQQGLIGITLPLPFVVEVQDQDNSPFAGVPVTFRVTAGGGQLSAMNTTTDVNGKAQADLTLGRTPGTITVTVTAAAISQSVTFTATAILLSSPVLIPDANLRGKITETLGKAHGGTITARDMLRLTALNANNANIYDLTGLQHASNLTTLSLNNNHLTEIALLAALTKLKTLSLDYNSLADLEPIAALPQLKTLNLRGNWLNDSAFDTHIPAMRGKGVNVRFDARTEDARPIVRLVYFLPNDRQPQPDIDEKMDRLIKEVQTFYADQMEAHGFGRKTFQIETDATGKVIVHHIKGQFPDVYYQNLNFTLPGSNLLVEITEKFDTSNTFLLTTLDVSSEMIGDFCGIGNWAADSGSALTPASGACFAGAFGIDVAAHELGHAFGLLHDFRDSAYLMSYGANRTELSYCAAEWLDAHRAFNPAQPILNAEWTKVEMLPPSLNAPSNAIRLRFEVTDSDGIHQVQLLTQTPSGPSAGYPELLSYKILNGSTNTTVEFVTTDLTPKNKSVSLNVIDVNGNISFSENFPINVRSLLSPTEDVNGDGTVNIQDLVMVASKLGQTGQSEADVNGDGTVNIQDLVLVAGKLGTDAATPAAWHRISEGMPSQDIVAEWVKQARRLSLTDARYQQGVLFLEHLLTVLAPKETALLANYPNPFNPETWIPYQLVQPAEVTLHIYAANGVLVQTLALGHRTAGLYHSKSRAAYWDGRNEQGERVASGIYFYTLSAGDFTATRKMLIKK